MRALKRLDSYYNEAMSQAIQLRLICQRIFVNKPLTLPISLFLYQDRQSSFQTVCLIHSWACSFKLSIISCFETQLFMWSFCILIIWTAYSETDNKGAIFHGPTKLLARLLSYNSRWGNIPCWPNKHNKIRLVWYSKAKIAFRHIQVYTIFTAYKWHRS